MRARLSVAMAGIMVVLAACQSAASPSPSAPAATGQATTAPQSAAPSADAETVLRFARISDFLPSIHPVDLGTGNQELMADIVFSTLVDVDSDEEHTSELQSPCNLVCRLLLEKKNKKRPNKSNTPTLT